MEKSFKITFNYEDGRNVHKEAKTQQEALEMVRQEINKDPTCCANIVMAEFEKETPNKQLVKVVRYARRGNNVVELKY